MVCCKDQTSIMPSGFYCLLIGIALLPLKKVLFLPIIGYKMILSDIFFFSSGMLVLFSKQKLNRLLQLRFFIVVAVMFLSWVLISLFMSSDSFSISYFAQLDMLAFLYNFYLFSIVYMMIDTPRKVVGLILAWASAVFIANVVGAFAVAFEPDWGFSYGILIGSFVGANQPQIILLPLLPLFLFASVSNRFSPLFRGVAFLLSFLSVLFVLISGSRSGFLMLGVLWIGCIIAYWKLIKEGKAISLVSFWGQQFLYGFLCLLVLLYGTTLSEFYSPLSGLKRVNRTYQRVVFHKYKRPVKTLTEKHYDRISSGRLGIIKAGYSLFKRDILFGYGLQKTRTLKGAHRHEMHCSYLVLLFETGIVGFLLALLLFGYILRCVLRVTKDKGMEVEGLILRSLLVGLSALAVYNLFTNGLRQRELWILLSVLFVMSSQYRADIESSFSEFDDCLKLR